MTTLFPEMLRRNPMNTLTDTERSELILSCEFLCKSLARKAATAAHMLSELDDLQQEAMLACCEAAKRFHADQGTKFTTYATAVIRVHLAEHIARAKPLHDATRPDDWAFVSPESDSADDAPESREPDADSLSLLSRLDPAAAGIVRKVVFDRTPPDRVATQLGMAVKDVKLLMRNAARTLGRERAWLDKPGLFGPSEDAA